MYFQELLYSENWLLKYHLLIHHVYTSYVFNLVSWYVTAILLPLIWKTEQQGVHLSWILKQKASQTSRSFTCARGLKTALLCKTEQAIIAEPCYIYETKELIVRSGFVTAMTHNCTVLLLVTPLEASAKWSCFITSPVICRISTKQTVTQSVGEDDSLGCYILQLKFDSNKIKPQKNKNENVTVPWKMFRIPSEQSYSVWQNIFEFWLWLKKN